MQRGRVFTVFEVDCRFGLPLRRPFLMQYQGERAAVILLAERSPLEFVDPTNSISAAVHKESADRPFRLAKPLGLPEDAKVFMQALTVAPKDIKLDSPEAASAVLAKASVLAIFDPLGSAISVRSRMTTEVAIAVERTQAQWRSLGKDKFDETHAAIWDEFVRTYQMITGDVRPPYWNDGHRLMVVKQGFVPYEEGTEAKDWHERLQSSCDGIPVDRHRVTSSYAQEGAFRFNVDEANEVMRRFLQGGVPVPLSRETLAGAQRAVDLHRSGKTSIIECTMAMEIAVSEVVAEAKLRAGVSKKKLDEYKKEVGLGYQLNVDLPMLLSPLSNEERSLIGAADAVRKRRNAIIHEGIQPSRQEGEQAVAAIRKLLDMLRSRGYSV